MYSYDPYDFLDQVPGFTLSSTSFQDGQAMPLVNVNEGGNPNGGDLSPALSWADFPAETKSFAITMFDPDAPTASGFWHWAVANIPADVTSLSEGNDAPAASIVLKNDAGYPGYMGAAPPAGHGVHRYMLVVHAVDVEYLDVDEDTSAAVLGFNLHFHTLARARITVTFEVPQA